MCIVLIVVVAQLMPDRNPLKRSRQNFPPHRPNCALEKFRALGASCWGAPQSPRSGYASRRIKELIQEWNAASTSAFKAFP